MQVGLRFLSDDHWRSRGAISDRAFDQGPWKIGEDQFSAYIYTYMYIYIYVHVHKKYTSTYMYMHTYT